MIKENKTLRFLLPVLITYGSIFVNYLNKLNRIAFGINDKAVVYEEDYLIYILFDITYTKELFVEFLEFIHSKSFYIDDYIYGKFTSDLHMVVIKFPDKFKKAYDNFKKGKYSQMYSNKEIEKYFKNIGIKNILKKSKGAEFLLIREIEQKFGKKILSIDDILKNPDKWEWAIPPLKKEEGFNNE